MVLYINNLKTIKQFLLRTDKALVAKVLDDILGAKHLWCTIEGGDRIYYLFANYNADAERSEVVKFWITNIRKYNYLFVYSMLFWWAEQWEDDDELKNRLASFRNRFSETIEKEIEDFINKTESIPLPIIDKIGIVIDAFLWITRYDVPFFLEGQKHKNAFPQPDLGKYFELFKINIPEDSVTTKIKKSVDSLLYYFKVYSLVVKFKKKYPSPMVGDTDLPWNWAVIKRYIEKRCCDFCKFGHNTFIGRNILDNFEIRNVVSKKRNKATQMFLNEIVEKIKFTNWDFKKTESDFIKIQEEYLTETLKAIQSEKFTVLNKKSTERLVQAVFSRISNTYIHKFVFDEYHYWENKDHSLPQKVLAVAEKFAQTYMRFYISSSMFFGETINEYISDEEKRILDRIVKEDLYQAIVEAQLNFVRKKLLGKETNKSDNQHDLGSQSSDYEYDPRTDPATSWVYQP